ARPRAARARHRGQRGHRPRPLAPGALAARAHRGARRRHRARRVGGRRGRARAGGQGSRRHRGGRGGGDDAVRARRAAHAGRAPRRLRALSRVRRGQALSRQRLAAPARRRRRHGRRSHRRCVRPGAPPARPARRMAVTSGVRLVAIGPPLALVDDDAAAVVTALAAGGVSVESRTLVDEDEAALERALTPATTLTVILAGPGGSTGDVVRRVLARATGTRLALNDRMLAALEAQHRRRDRPLPRRDERLALLPQGAVVWTDGEPAWALESDAAAWVVLPRGGLGSATTDSLVDFARARLGRAGAVATRTLRTAGVALGDVETRLAPWLGPGEGGEVAVTASPTDGEVWVRLRARGATPEAAAEALAAAERDVTHALGADCYGRDGELLEQAVGRHLVARGLTVAVAESCTGGLVGHRLTGIAGSSA